MKTLATVLLLLLSPAAFAGTDVGHGGDAVECVPSSANPLKGLYQVDYVMTLGPDDKPSIPDVPARKWEESVERIRSLLLQKYPELGRAFGDFLADINNFSDYQRPRIWTPTAHGLIQIDDQIFVRALPENCVGKSKDSASVFQAVVRIEKPRIVEYEADYKILKNLERFPIQYSFMLVHEWLWDYTNDVQAIRWANRLLHSESLDRLSPEALRASLRNIGISTASPHFKPVCSRSEPVTRKIEALFGKPCENITEKELAEFAPLDGYGHPAKYILTIAGEGPLNLKPGDFSGMPYLGTLRLGGNQITSIQEGVLAGLNGLEDLDLTDNKIRRLPRGFFAGLPSIRVATITNNLVEEIEPGLLSDVTTGNFVLDLQKNNLKTVPADFLHFGAKVYFNVNIRDNPIESLPETLFDFVSPSGGDFRMYSASVCGNSKTKELAKRAEDHFIAFYCQ